MWELDCEESWAPKNWCFWTVVLEKTLESPLDCKEIQPVHSKGDQPWVFFGRNDAKAETPILWPPHVNSWLIGKDSDAGRDWGQEGKGTTEDELAGWHHRLNGHEFEWTPGLGDGQGCLAWCDSWSHKESDTTELLNWTVPKFSRCNQIALGGSYSGINSLLNALATHLQAFDIIHWDLLINLMGDIWLTPCLTFVVSVQLLSCIWIFCSVQFTSVAQSCLTLCDPMNGRTPGLPGYHQLPDFTQTHIHRVGDAIQPAHPLSSPSPPAPNPSQHQSLFQ